MEEEILQQGANIERATSTTTQAILQESTSTIEPLEQSNNTIISKEGPHQVEVEESINIVTKGVPQEAPSTIEPMEEEPEWEGPKAERTVGATEEEDRGLMDGIDLITQESIWINVVLEEIGHHRLFKKF